MLWDDLARFAPRTKAVWEHIGNASVTAVLDRAPDWLIPTGIDQSHPGWGDLLNSMTEYGTSVRERMLRYLITRAVVDQGSDIVGVEMWHSRTFSRLYEAGIPLLDDPGLFNRSHAREILEIADSCRIEVTEERAEIWASAEPGRRAASYSPFMVDGQRGMGNTFWFLSARVLPTLFLSAIHPGGLTDHVFGRSDRELPKEMARRLRNDPQRCEGLSWVMGDKACDLFAKWAVGTFRLVDGLDCPWSPADCPIPMDQRIGRLMIRTGFMDEFFGVVGEMSVKTHGFTPRSGQIRPERDDVDIPDGTWHLTVMDFRRQGQVTAQRRPLARKWIESARREFGLPPESKPFFPQDVVSLLCRAHSQAHGALLTPVEVDDFFMRVGGAECSDFNPDCESCALGRVCQANTDPTMAGLKSCIT